MSRDYHCFPSENYSNLLVEWGWGRKAQIQNMQNFQNVNILALTRLFENTFLQNNLFLNS